MFCLVDFRRRPQFQYTFPSREKARECLRKIENNSLGVTIFHLDGRREYFEEGLPAMLRIAMQAGLSKNYLSRCNKSVRIKKGCHVKYKIQKLNNLDCLRKAGRTSQGTSFENWRKKSAPSLFMIGNRKIYAGLAIMAFLIFSSSLYFQNQYGRSAAAESRSTTETQGQIAGAADAKTESDGESSESLKLADEEVILNLLGKIEEVKEDEFEREILKYIKDRPMEAMAPYIAKQPRMVAAFIVGIAMKESKFGVYAPHSGGRDCFNYWGYKGRENTTASGYSCFSSPEHAIQVVGKKIDSLVARGISNPAEMISWKCGSSCAGHGEENVRKWIADVGIYFSKINS